MGGKNEAIVGGERARRDRTKQRGGREGEGQRDPLFPSFSIESINATAAAAGKEGTALTHSLEIFNVPFFSLPFSASPSLPRTPTTETDRPRPRSSRRRRTTPIK